MKRTIYITGIWVVVAIIFFCLNLFVPYYDDDVWYSLHYIPGEILSPITQFSDILVSQYHHYIGENSRALIHVSLQSLLSVLPDWGFDLVNTAIFLLLVYLVTIYTQPRHRAIQPIALLLTVIGIYGLMPDMDYLFYWAAGSLNYLWSSVATMLFLLIWHSCRTENDKIKNSSWLYAIISFICAFTHEAFALPICATILLHMIANYRDIGYNNKTLMALAYGIGGLAILLAPGMENKTSHIAYESTHHYIQQLIITVRNLRAIPLCMMIAAISCSKKSWRTYLTHFIKANRDLLFIAIMAFLMIAVVRAGAYNLRTFYAAEFFALLVLLRYIHPILDKASYRWRVGLSIAICMLIVGWSIIVLPAAHRTGKQHRALFTEYSTDNDGVLFIAQESTPSIAQAWVMNLHKYYYNTPESQWRAFVIPLVGLNDTLRVPSPLLARNDDYSYKLYNKYIEILPHSIKPAIEQPDQFFILQNKVAGNNPFYITSDSCYIIAAIDTLSSGNRWQWHYHKASWREPSASIPGFFKRCIAPQTLPLTQPIEYPDTVSLPDRRSYVIYARPPYRTLKSIEPRDDM